jgi:hypothetical protein
MIGLFDVYTIAHICDYLDTISLSKFAITDRACWRNITPILSQRLRNLSLSNKNNLLCLATKSGNETLVKKIIEAGANDIDKVLWLAAACGHRHLCILARHDCDYNMMLWGAALGGHLELCILARQWGACDFNEMLEGAAQNGNRYLCELAKQWGANDFDNMLYYVAKTCAS